MSVEYTIDIQLTELGFLANTPDSQDTSSTSPAGSSPPCHPPTARSGTCKQQLLLNGHQPVKQDGRFEGSAVDLTPPLSTPAHLHGSLRPEQDKKLLQRPVVVLTPLPIRPKQLKQDQSVKELSKKAAQKGSAEEKQDIEDDSDDSYVSGVYEDDEEDEEDEEEEEPNGMSHSPHYYKHTVNCC